MKEEMEIDEKEVGERSRWMVTRRKCRRRRRRR